MVLVGLVIGASAAAASTGRKELHLLLPHTLAFRDNKGDFQDAIHMICRPHSAG